MRFIFIDRDGVINKDPGGWTKHNYVTRVEDLHFLPGALEALRLLSRSGTGIIVISNQAGISKGYFNIEALRKVNDRLVSEVSNNGGRIAEVFYCTHKDEDNCDCRKPKTGLIERAVKKYNIDITDTYVIGDSRVDIEAGKKMGIRTILVLSGKTTAEDALKWPERPDYVFPGLLEAVRWLVAKEKRRSDRALKRRKMKGD